MRDSPGTLSQILISVNDLGQLLLSNVGIGIW